MLQAGQTAPDLYLPDADMEMVRLSSFKKRKNLVLYFYSKDDTPGCTAQALEFSDLEDKFANLHIISGKKSFEAAKLKDNVLAIISAILRERPAALKGVFIKSICITSTMGPGIKLDVASVSNVAKK